jgi:hypothetical protein
MIKTYGRAFHTRKVELNKLMFRELRNFLWLLQPLVVDYAGKAI